MPVGKADASAPYNNQPQVPQSSAIDWMTTDEAASYLKVKPRTLLLWSRQGKVKGYPLSGTKRRVWRYRREELNAAVFGDPVICSVTPSVLFEGRIG